MVGDGGGREGRRDGDNIVLVVYHCKFIFIEFQKRHKVTEVTLCQLYVFNFVEMKRKTNQIFHSISKRKKVMWQISRGGPLVKHLPMTSQHMHHYQTRGANKYVLPKCRTERLHHSFFPKY